MSALRLLLPVLAVLVWRSCCALDTESSPIQSPPAPESLRSNPCSSSGSSCGECLRQPQCAWCTQQVCSNRPLAFAPAHGALR
ncbi:hypothetical protein IscW_ISCW010208 [Ixodes scapularis]|uniref:Integrin beta N-terminal domain-containing protein n=1 Tax=Ixodes scapularis TaxID=6945 RepID=B7PZ31_IXOSC|nr:hypothetical protein IscW_ISCW010208 [Ixodes scapularis]|eukprot:XP_002404553.1 hypothetical protein IscW_ISCW010208 [Ixodes scapularis]